ncbi:hypothetical protein CGMCC3_g6861 [Colletotrichum fructicola]|nr:uncharacterized protein CGMCC3_g6861 [Colletotrichum fructicola]KAE9577001.1 hypothetical protein CGMCC3_g6861 [Colletotrichum fructicola]
MPWWAVSEKDPWWIRPKLKPQRPIRLLKSWPCKRYELLRTFVLSLDGLAVDASRAGTSSPPQSQSIKLALVNMLAALFFRPSATYQKKVTSSLNRYGRTIHDPRLCLPTPAAAISHAQVLSRSQELFSVVYFGRPRPAGRPLARDRLLKPQTSPACGCHWFMPP